LVLVAYDFALLPLTRDVWVREHDLLLSRHELFSASHVPIACAVFTCLLNAPIDNGARYVEMINGIAVECDSSVLDISLRRSWKKSKRRRVDMTYCCMFTSDRAVVEKWRPYVEAGL
jgi:hypothetical protein